jgi:hypothetical protein
MNPVRIWGGQSGAEYLGADEGVDSINEKTSETNSEVF